MVEPKVSIAIPVYNGADYLDEAIQSALGQTYKNIEVIVVNDGSCDGGATERVALCYGERIRYISKANGGVASALNLAIQAMTGVYFSWLSHDDLYYPVKIERGLEYVRTLPLAEQSRTITYSDYAVFSNDPDNIIPVRLPGVDAKEFRFWLTTANSLHGCTLLIPRVAFTEYGGFDESLRTTQDYELWYRLAGTYRFRHLPQVLVKARSHSEQGSIKMATTALAECNTLLSQFTIALTEGELIAGGHCSQATAYAEISASLWRRGFLSAATTAARLSIRRLVGEPVRVALPVFGTLGWGIAQYHILPIARSFMPPTLRLLIKRLCFFQGKPRITLGQSSSAKFLKQKFSEIYAKNIFGGSASRSGAGSDLVQTETIRRELPALLAKLHVRSFLDAPCGDWYWMRQLDLGVETYIGVDIVEDLIAKNQREFGNTSTNFHCINLTQDELPKVDLIFSRDCFVHLSLEDALRVIANYKRSGSKYLLTTTFVNRNRNSDLVEKNRFWRPLNMQLPPFNFPPPLMLINEGCTEEGGLYTDKCLGLWFLNDLEC